MPNWAVTNIRFSSNATPESVNAIVDLYNRIRRVQDITFDYIITPNMKSYYKSSQNCEISLYALHTLGFGIDFYKVYRGNIVNISPIYYRDNQTIDFQIVTHDAWETNADMFLNIASQFYNNLIKVDFVTGLSEYEEAGEYITNSNEFAGRSRVKLYLEGLDNVLKYKELWDYSNPLFPSLNDVAGVDNANGYWSCQYCYTPREIKSSFTSKYIPPCLSYEGSLNYDDVKEIPDSIISIYEDYQSPNTDYNPGLFCDINTVRYVNPEVRFDTSVEAEPIYDNFTTFLGGDSNE